MKHTKRIDLESLKPSPHPFRAVFRGHKVTDVMLANYLKRHASYVSNLLAGHFPMPVWIHEKLETLARQLEEESVA